MICTISPMRPEHCERYRFSEDEASFGSLSTPQGHLPLRQLRLEGKTVGLAYRMRLTQTFINVYGDSLEATYIFPLPARAAVTGFLMRTPDREVIGELQEREQARATYDQAIAAGHQAAIAEEERPEVFTMRVGNIAPYSQIEIELELSGPLMVADGMATFRFPLVVAPRYMPGRPIGGGDIGSGIAFDTDATPDASRISPPVLLAGYPNPVQLSIELDLDLSALGLHAIECSLHELMLEQSSSGQTRLRLSPETGQLNRDLVVRFPVLTENVRGVLNQLPDPDGGACTWGLTLLPPADSLASEPRQVIILLDRSGSMQGWKMAAARRAVGRIVDSLKDNDSYAVLAFDDMVEQITGMTGATDRNRYRTVENLGRVESRGGTEMAQALNHGLNQFGSARGMHQFLVLITDGQVGNEDQILQEMQRRARGCASSRSESTRPSTPVCCSAWLNSAAGTASWSNPRTGSTT